LELRSLGSDFSVNPDKAHSAEGLLDGFFGLHYGVLGGVGIADMAEAAKSDI